MPNYSDMAAGGFLHFDLLAWFSFLFLAFVSDLLLSLLFHSQPSSLSFLACPLALSSFKGRSFHLSLVFVFCSSPSAFPKITSNEIPVPTCASKAVPNAAEMWAHSYVEPTSAQCTAGEPAPLWLCFCWGGVQAVQTPTHTVYTL